MKATNKLKTNHLHKQRKIKPRNKRKCVLIPIYQPSGLSATQLKEIGKIGGLLDGLHKAQTYHLNLK